MDLSEPRFEEKNVVVKVTPVLGVPWASELDTIVHLSKTSQIKEMASMKRLILPLIMCLGLSL